jgi:probable rRNA maturation factor
MARSRDPLIRVPLSNRQKIVPVDKPALRRAVLHTLASEGVAAARIHLVIVDDATIQGLNRRYLSHDEPTDVLTFPQADEGGGDGILEGEIVISAQTAARAAPDYRSSVEDEMALYAVHGVLHLLGYDDLETSARARMRSREKTILAELGMDPHYEL